MEEPFDVTLEYVCNLLWGAANSQQPSADGTCAAAGNSFNIL